MGKMNVEDSICKAMSKMLHDVHVCLRYTSGYPRAVSLNS